MYHGTKTHVRTVFIMPRASVRPRLLQDIAQDARFQVMGDFSTLDAAYAPTEAQKPNLAVCHKNIARMPEFPMFAALLHMIGSTLITVDDFTPLATVLHKIGLPDVAPNTAPPPATLTRSAPLKLVAIGASTGGIEALRQLLSAFPTACPPTVIVQHIQHDYLAGVVSRLDRVCRPKVVAAQPNMKLANGQIIIAPGLPSHLEIKASTMRCAFRDAPPVSGHRPSVDVLFESVSALKDQAVGVLLTGMGRDGAAGLGQMRRAGAWTIAQDEATSTVYGMPRVAVEEGAVCESLPLPKISQAILAAAADKQRSLV